MTIKKSPRRSLACRILFGQQVLPTIYGQNGTGNGNGQNSLLEAYTAGDGYRHSHSTYYQFDENLTKVIGRHSLQFGARYRLDHIVTNTGKTGLPCTSTEMEPRI